MHLKRDPLPYITAEPLPRNLLEWHYVVQGPEDTAYAGGYYHGILLFPRVFPFKPPAIYMLTPNGRFLTNTRLCLSISDFHPDTWNPTWSVSTILTGLMSFMLEKTPTFGSIVSSPYEKQQLAKRSLTFNLNDPVFCELFPEICAEIKKKLSTSTKALQEPTKSPIAALPSKATKSFNSNDVHDKNVLEVISMKTAKVADSLKDTTQSNGPQVSYTQDLDIRYAWILNAAILFCFAIFLIVVHHIIVNVTQ